MANKTEFNKKEPNKSQPAEKDGKNVSPDKNAKKKSGAKKSSAVTAATMGRSAVDHMKPDASRDVRGSSGIANTGPFVSYED